MLSVANKSITLSVIMLNVIMRSVVVLSVVGPEKEIPYLSYPLTPFLSYSSVAQNFDLLMLS